MTPSISTEHKISWKCRMTANIAKIFLGNPQYHEVTK